MSKQKPVEQNLPWKPKQNEAIWVVGTMVIIILALVLIPMFMRMFATFDYQGLTFTKEKFGEILVYHYSYYFIDDVGQQYQYNLYLRNDPRTNVIPIDSNITFKEDRKVYITLNSTALAQCPNGLRDIASIARFLSDNLISVQAGNINAEVAIENNLTYITCENRPDNAVILIVPSNETKITQIDECHTVSYATCEEVLPALEKFMVKSILDAKQDG